MNILSIDTTSNEIIRIGLSVGGVRYGLEEKLDRNKAQVVLRLIDKLLSRHKITFNELTEIQVNAGPGSFTGIRVGLTVANTLAFLLKIPINGRPVGEMAEPVYS